jgi:N-acetylmuramic acid 6-phosphate etherase
MTLPDRKTERQLPDVAGIDTWSDAKILDALVSGQERAIAAVRAAGPAIAEAAGLLAARLKAGGRLAYAGAGASIRIAVQDGSELPATFGMPEDRILYLVAGGRAAMFDTSAAAEDDEEAGRRDAQVLAINDTLIAVAASGRTPYTLAAARTARAKGASVIAVVNNRESLLTALADVAIELDSGPEVIVGSTRMGAGTAQKACLNLLSTLTNIRLGAVHDGYMVNVMAENGKLRERACMIVMQISGCDSARAAGALATTAGNVKLATLLCSGAADMAAAQRLLSRSDGNLRQALELLGGSKSA